MRYWPYPVSILEWFVLSLLIFLPRVLHLDVFLTADEPLFLEHAREFAAGVASGDFNQTIGIGYPGVTVAALAAPLVQLSQTPLEAYAAGRLTIALLTGVLLLIVYALSRKLLGRWPAFIGVAMLALDPYTLGYSRLLHIAAPLALLMTLAGLSLLLWLHTEQYRWVWLAGIFTGLALLTKSTALLLGPMLGVVILSWGLTSGQWRDRRWQRRQLGGVLALGFAGVVIFFLLWPAMWVDPVYAVTLTFGKLFTDQEAGAGNLGMFWLGRFVEDPGPAFYPVAFLLKSTPWLLIGLILSLIHLFTAYRKSQQTPPPPTSPRNLPTSREASLLPALSLWLFALTYLIIMTIATKKSIRYMLPAFPTFYLLTGLAFHHTILKLEQLSLHSFSSSVPAGSQTNRPSNQPSNLPTNHPLYRPISFFLILLLSLTLFAFIYHPYYFTYYNPLLLGWRWAPQTLLVGWGEGLDGAARYLNEQPPQPVSAWYEWLFSIFYHGQVKAVVPQENLITANRTVLYINQVQRDIPGPNIIHYFRTRRRPEYTVRLAGIDYAWVYPGPIAGFEANAAPQHPVGGEFGGEARLLGYDLEPDVARSGDPVIVTLHWQSLAPPPADRFVFLRLIDESGHVWANADSPPVMGLWPVSRWQPGMFIEDAHELPIPAGTPPGAYRLEVGMYDPGSGQPLAAASQPVGPGGGLLVGYVAVEWQPRQQIQVDLPHRTQILLSDNVDLIGYSALPQTAMTGDLLPVDLIYRENSSFLSLSSAAENFVLFEWTREGTRLAEQLESLPLPVEQWGHGSVLRAYHEIIVPATLETGRYELRVSMHTGQTPLGEPFLLGAVDVTAPVHRFELPPEVTLLADSNRLIEAPEQVIKLVGYKLAVSGATLESQLVWQPESLIQTQYKVFAQLLDDSNTVIAQSDAVPGSGQRSTTGWLPNEVIIDPHTLTLPADLPAADQPYRLIAGLYNPLNGQRLPVLNSSGEVIADAVVVAEVTLNGEQ